jgi:hypothetical protein
VRPNQTTTNANALHIIKWKEAAKPLLNNAFSKWSFDCEKSLSAQHLLGGLAIDLEDFVALVRKDGRVTVPKTLRDRFGVSDGSYIHLALLEVHKKGKDGTWKKHTLEH